MNDPFRNNDSGHGRKRARIKVCGVATAVDIATCSEAGVDAVGFLIGQEKYSPAGDRLNDKLTPHNAAALARLVPDDMSSVMLVHATAANEIVELCETVNARAIQLQSNLTLTTLEQLRTALRDVRVIKTLHVDSNTTTANLVRTAVSLCTSGYVDAILLDSRTSGKTGGTGQIHDWRLSRAVVERVSHFPVILAGGLTPTNVSDACDAVRPYAVDVLTGVKLSEGKKDPAKITAFVQALTTAD